MARPKTHGAPISFRLPIDYDERLAKKAAAKSESPAEYVRRNIIRGLDADDGAKRNGAKPRSLARDKVTPVPKSAPVKATARKRAVGR